MVKDYLASSTLVRLAAILALAVATIATPNVTYAFMGWSSSSSPAIYKSPVGSKFIGSKRIQYMNITLLSNSTSQFLISLYNKTTTSSYRKYTLLSAGSWSHLVGTKETLSCSLVFEANTSTFGFLQFLSNIESLQMYANISLASLRGFLPAANSSADQTVIADNFVLGAGCYLGQLFGTLYNISNSGNILTPVTLPQNWAIQASIESFVYVISNNQLYRYNQALNQYDQIYSFSNFSQYLLFEYQGRILVSASNNISNATVANVTTFRVSQTIYLLVDAPSGPSLIFRVDLDGYSNLTNIQVFTSTKLTKFAYEYTPIGNSSAIIVVKSIDYIANKVIDLMWRDYARFLQTRAAATYAQIIFDDNFLVIRNGTPKAVNNSLVAVEEGYQYVNNQIIYFNQMIVTSVTNWQRIMVNSNYELVLSSINLYKYPTYYSAEFTNFQSYVASKKIVPTPQPSFIKFSISNQPVSTNLERLCWSDTKSISPNIVLTISCYDPSSPGNIKSFNSTFQATMVFTKAVSQPEQTKCRILLLSYSNGTSSFLLAEYMAANNTLAVTYDLRPALASLTATVSITNLPMMLSPNCDRFNVGSNPKYVYHKVNNTFQSASNSGLFMANFTDRNLTYAIYGSTIWKYDTAQSQYVSYFNLSTLYPVVSFKAYQNRLLVVASTSITSAAKTQVLAFLDQNGNLTQFFNATFILTKYVAVKISSNITKVAVLGLVGSQFTIKLYHIDFINKQASPISLILPTIVDYSYFTFNLFDQYIHVRQAKSDYMTSSADKVFYFYNDVKPQMVLNNGFTQISVFASYIRGTIIVINSSVYLANEIYQSSQTSVNIAQLNFNQTIVSKYINPAINAYYSGGVVKICPPGCNQCSNQICTSCVSDRYVLNSKAGLCVLCPYGCKKCDSEYPQLCSSGGLGFFLDSNGYNTPCSSQCVTCTSITMCTVCYPGYYVKSTSKKCQSCPRNCLECSSATSCTLCRRGFVATSSGTCRGCSLSCSSCLAENITQCTACAIGLELQGYQCVQCPANCQVCNQGYCLSCAPGYTPKAGACSLNCKLPCATCAQGQPSTCLSCFGSSILNGSTCVFDISCNATADCTDCGQIYGLFLFEFNCYPCSSVANISNCIQCSQFNQYKCVICEDGYFPTFAGSCQACPSACITCKSPRQCTSCTQSFTFALNKTEGVCIACQSPCATCSGDPTYCLTCVTGYIKKYWKCQNNSFIGFSLTLSGAGVDASQVLAGIDALITSLLTSIGENLTNIDVITITTVFSASVVVSGTIAPTSGDTSAASSGLSAGLSSGTIAGFTVTASSITLEGGSDSSSGLKTEAIIGLAVGAFCFLIIILILIVCMCKSKEKRSRRVVEEFSQKYRNNPFFFDTAAVREQPSREMIAVEVISPQRRIRRRQ